MSDEDEKKIESLKKDIDSKLIEHGKLVQQFEYQERLSNDSEQIMINDMKKKESEMLANQNKEIDDFINTKQKEFSDFQQENKKKVRQWLHDKESKSFDHRDRIGKLEVEIDGLKKRLSNIMYRQPKKIQYYPIQPQPQQQVVFSTQIDRCVFPQPAANYMDGYQ